MDKNKIVMGVKMSEFNERREELLYIFDELVANATKFIPERLQQERNEAYSQIRLILENIWVEGEPGHEEYHIHPKAFEESDSISKAFEQLKTVNKAIKKHFGNKK